MRRSLMIWRNSASSIEVYDNNGTYEQPQTTLKASDYIGAYGTPREENQEISFDTIDKTGVLNIRINPKVKTLTTAILKEMGLTMSQTVTLVSILLVYHTHLYDLRLLM